MARLPFALVLNIRSDLAGCLFYNAAEDATQAQSPTEQARFNLRIFPLIYARLL